jgi:recombination protein RecR
MLHIPALEQLVHELCRLPGIGPKTAQRLAYYILRSREDYVDRMVNALQRVKAEVHMCKQCFNYTDSDLCRYCTDPYRVDDILCVVEEPSDILRIEGSGAFRGRYHVLHGAISPLDGIGPEDLKIRELLNRLDQAANGSKPEIREIILALSSDLEGDTTVLYLTKLLHQTPNGKKLKLSRIAQGVPIGSDIDFVDDRTMGRALENRVEL